MNSLSWAIYLIGLSDTISTSFAWLIGLSAIASIVLTVFNALLIFNPNDRDTQAIEESGGGAIIRKAWMIAMICLVFSIAIQIVTPSRDTAVLAAAAEVGQIPIGQTNSNVMDPSAELLRTFIQEQLAIHKNNLQQIVSPPTRSR